MKISKERIKQLIRENFESSEAPTLDADYFKERITFFENFEDKTYNDNVVFEYSKNWRGENAPVLPLGEGNESIKFLYFSVDIKFDYYPIIKRDFNSNEPKFFTEHQFIYVVHIYTDYPKSTKEKNKYISNIVNSIMEKSQSISDSFVSYDDKPFPEEKLNRIMNGVAKNLLKIDIALSNMGVDLW